ncbi:hypothetical protein CAB17_00115 [Legionella sainthelensi]|uniref:Uncharacterized protein n=1 Tax=Legionella sainthelensi TaxID=28087 RepID=A0A2H5FGF0_9GAMM|nr:hypothetical protein CAB17_00115 [Legionella sainthelensi]
MFDVKPLLLLNELNIFILAHKEVWLKWQGPDYEFWLNMRENPVSGLHQRPEEIDSRERFGYWEGDTIEFKGNKSNL